MRSPHDHPPVPWPTTRPTASRLLLAPVLGCARRRGCHDRSGRRRTRGGTSRSSRHSQMGATPFTLPALATHVAHGGSESTAANGELVFCP